MAIRLKAGRRRLRRRVLSGQLEQEMTQHEASLWDRIFSRENLFRALQQVQRNGGAPGVDGMTVEELPDHLRVERNWRGGPIVRVR